MLRPRRPRTRRSPSTYAPSPRTWTAVSSPRPSSPGRLTANANGTFTYTPALNFFGPDSFTYKVNDGELNSNVATMTLTVTAVNDAPVAANAQASTFEDNALALDLRTFATDVDSSALTALVVTSPAHGVLTQNANGTFTYTPNANFNGSDSLTYKVNDGALDSNVATVAITVVSVNDAPRGTSKTVTTAEDTPYVFTLADFGFSDPNDTPANNFTAVTVTTLPLAGSLQRNGVAVTLGQSVTAADIAAGLLRFAPALNVNGTGYASFGFRVQDDGGTTNGGVDRDPTERTITVNVTAVNDAPVAANAQASTLEDNALVLDLRTFATDVDGDTLTALVVTGPAHGVLTQNANGTFTYTPSANFNGSDSFTYKVNDGALDSNVATVAITIVSVNDAPRGTNKTVTTAEDTPYVFTLADFGFSDPSDTPANNFTAVTVSTLPLAGSLLRNGVAVTAGQSVTAADIAAGLLRFAPALNANGTGYANFGFRVQDDGGTANGGVDRDPVERTITVNVTAVNDAPVAANAQASTFEENANGTFTYTPSANFNGSDSFTYKVNDGALDSNVATVAITIVSVNDAPRGTNKTVTTAEDTPYVFTLADFGFSDPSDTPANNFTAVTVSTLPLAGSLLRNGVAVTAGQSVTAADIAAGLLRFAPALNANGTGYANFGFRVQDDGGTANGGVDRDPTERTITVNVTAVNDAPVAANAQASTLEDNALVLDLRTFATDVDGDALTALVVASPAHGVLTANANGTFTYTPNANFNGSDSFTYKVNDGALDSNVATVAITVVSVNDAPVASDASLTTKNNATLLVDPRTFATDVDSTVLTTQIVTGPTHGTLAPNADGTYTYTPTAGFVGADSFRYTVSDGQLTSNQATVNISVTASNSAPVAVSSSITGVEDTPYVFAWADFHVTDADSTTLSIVVGSLPASGQLQFLNGTTWTAVTLGQTVTQANISAGNLRFTPAANASGIDAYPTAGVGNLKKDYANFTYQGSDGALLSNVATMTIDIAPVADAPTLTLGTTGNGASRELFRNSWETATNPNTGSTLVTTSPFEGWTLVTSPDSFAGGTNGFEIWTTGDQMPDSGGVKR